MNIDTAASVCPVAEGDSETFEIGDRIRKSLRDAGYHGLRNASFEFCDGVVTLRGTVCSFYLKQVAQVAVQNVDDVRQVCNRIQVIEPLARRTASRV